MSKMYVLLVRHDIGSCWSSPILTSNDLSTIDRVVAGLVIDRTVKVINDPNQPTVVRETNPNNFPQYQVVKIPALY